MKLKVSSPTKVLDTELPPDMTLEVVAMLMGGECGISAPILSMNGRMLAPLTASLEAAGVKDGATIVVSTPGNPIPVPPELKQAYQWWEQISANPYEKSNIAQSNPDLHKAIETKDLVYIQGIFKAQAERKRESDAERVRRAAALQANPFDVEAQRAMEEEINKDNVETLRQNAIEHMPESFASVTMLYVNVVIHGVPLKAFVDSGAQMTIMSAKCAERVGLMRLCDTRFAGTAVGVGTQKILGKVHMAQLEIGGSYLPTSLSILEDQGMECLLGLDMLKRHRMIIDLEKNCLRWGSSSVPFLSEGELPESAKLNRRAPSQEVADGGGGGGGAGGGAAAAAHPTASIKTLTDLGFSQQEAAEGLAVSNGDVDAAASYLFSMKT